MDHSRKLCESIKNNNSDDDDWELKISKFHWTVKQQKLFNQVVKVLDYDRLARLAYSGIEKHEVVHRRTIIDKSAERMRKALATVAWDTILIQWIHNLLMENLPPTYLAAYLDIMQALRAKLPSLIDKMIFWKPGNINQELLAPILKKPWQVQLTNKYRKIPGSVLFVVIPSASPRVGAQSPRIQKLYTLFSTMAPLLPIQIPTNSITSNKQSLQSIAEQTVSVTRTKIQELKSENPDRRLILIGLNSGSFVAMQVALVEQVSGVVCFGFSYNTVHGVRGQPDDYYTESNTPTMFIIGQNSAKCSEEELENFKEKISVPTSTVIVGSADDYLRINKTKRRLEGVTQEMVDNMIVDEIAEFATNVHQRPLPKIKHLVSNSSLKVDSSFDQIRKRKMSSDYMRPTPMKTQKLMRPTSTSDEAIEMAVQSILPSENSEKKIYNESGQLVQRSVLQVRTLQGGGNLITRLPSGNKFYSIANIPSKKNFTLHNNVADMKASRSHNSSPTGQMQQPSQLVIKRSSAAHEPKLNQKFSPTKYTIVKSSTPGSSQNFSTYVTETTDTSTSDASNIYDMPVVFADSDGNVAEESVNDDVISVSSGDSPIGVQKKVIIKASTQQTLNQPQLTVTKNKNILIQKSTPIQGKMLMINGRNVLAKPMSATNIVLPKSTITKLMPGMTIMASSSSLTRPQTARPIVQTPPIGRKIEILNNQIIRPATSSTNLTKSSSFINLADAKPMQISANRLSLPTSNTTKANQIIIRTNSLKPYTGSTITAPITKQLGNLTVKRVIPPSNATITKKP